MARQGKQHQRRKQRRQRDSSAYPRKAEDLAARWSAIRERDAARHQMAGSSPGTWDLSERSHTGG